MNKLVKGSIAGGLGIALLLGGASTFALWNAELTAPAGTISTGELKIADATTPAGAWTEQSTTGTANGAVGSTLATSGTGSTTTVTPKMVPGDTWRYTRTIKLTTTGKNLLADLTFDPASLVASSGIPASELSYSFSATPVAATGAAAISTPSANVVRVTPGTAATTDVVVTLDVKFNDISATSNNSSSQAQTINAGALKFTLKQVRP